MAICIFRARDYLLFDVCWKQVKFYTSARERYLGSVNIELFCAERKSMMPNSESSFTRARIWEIALAGLLHDIGKLLQRGNSPEELQSIEQDLETFCPSDSFGHRTYHHAAYTAAFCESICAT